MSGSGLEHDITARNYRPSPFGRQLSAPESQSPGDNSSPFEVSPIVPYSSLATLAESTYSSPPLGVDPSLSPSTNYLSPSGQSKASGHESPDPDDFYRQPDELDANATSDLGNVTTGASNSMAGYRNPNDRVSSLPANVLDPPRTRRPTYRSTSDSPTLGGPSAFVSSNFTSTRSRNTSIKDLVSKFEQKSDQVFPPLSASRTASRAASPAASVDGDHSRFAPRRQLRDSRPPISVTNKSRPQLDSTPASPDDERLPETSAIIPPPLVERIPISHPRRLLFGELLSLNTQFNNLGHGIPAHLRRRGSDGGIPSPNPAFAEQSDLPLARSPLTPTAWYLGQAGSLEAVSAANTAHQRMNGHRRVQSDLSTNSQREPLADPWELDMAVSVPLQLAKPGDGSPDSPDSKSRIPVSSHRLVTASGFESLSPTANNPTFSSRSNAIPLPPKGSSRLPKPSLKDSPPRMKENDPALFAITTRGRRDMTVGRTRPQVPERNQHLQAYISVPPPKKSPPLRSSRPRQPVSHGAPISPRSRVGDRISSLQKSADRDTEARNPRHRQRRIPELGNVDFETRRQRIQQAFNRTVQENERKEEEAAEIRRRKSQLLEAGDDVQSPSDETTLTLATAVNLTPPPVEMATVVKESTETVGDDNVHRNLPQMNLITVVDPPSNDAPRTDMDSPTLGIPDGRHRELCDNVPDSAVTASSDETHTTHFDIEPQSDLIERKPSADHRTLLNHIMKIRESSDSDSCDEPECSMSETDEKQSIQIMLRDTTYYNSASTTDTEEPRQLARHSQAAQHQTRWSLSSWSSSVHNQNCTCDDECDESGDDLALRISQPGQEEPPTQSCSAASTRAPSENGDPIQDIGVMGPESLKNTPQMQSSTVFSTPPSLAKQGRWDSRRATQLYLEELTRGRNNSNVPLSTTRAPHDYSSLEVDTRGHGQVDGFTDDGVVVPRFVEKPSHERLSHGASLVGREDWENASPSIMDWMHVAAEDEDVTPAYDKPEFINDGAPTPTPRLMNPVAELEGSNDPTTGLGVSLNRQAAYELQRRPVELSGETVESASEESQTIQAPLSVSGRVPTLRDPTLSTASSADSSFQRVESTQSPRAAGSSATSLAPSFEHPALVEPKKSPSPEQRHLKKRRHIIKELVDTEYTFGRDMKVVDDIYKGTSSSCLDLSVDDVKVLFGNSDQIVQFSMSLQDALKKAARSVYVMPRSQRWASRRNTRNPQAVADEQPDGEGDITNVEKDRATNIGAAFVTHMTQMEKVYTEYLRNHDAANKKLQLLQHNPKVAIWLKECRDWASDLTSAWDLDSLLVKPVQRILKYPLLLADLLESTPEEHPDRATLSSALLEVTNISIRINEMKKRADLVTQVVGRKRNQSDVRTGLSKAFGRRTEKLRQQVGLSDMYEDKEYDALAEKFAEQFIQLQLVVRDVQDYVESTKRWMIQFNELATSIEAFLDVHNSPYPELESKWRQFRITVRDIITYALPEHIDVVMKSCIDPTSKVISLYTGPERVMKKRQKRLLDYGRYKSIMERGEKPDKKTTEQGEQFIALNETLKDELPRLFALSSKFGQACLQNLADIQLTWWTILQQKVAPFVEIFPDDMQKLVSDWNSDFSFSEAQVLSLGICNGSLMAETVNLVNFNTPSTKDVNSRRPSTTTSSNPRPHSFAEDSPKVSYEYGTSQLFQSPRMSSHSGARTRAESSFSGRAQPEPLNTPDLGRSQLLQQVTNSLGTNSRPSMEAESFPSLPRLSLDTPFLADVINAPSSVDPVGEQPPLLQLAATLTSSPAPVEPTVLFHVASLYEFNIDRSRREAGYPYLIYDTGDIFDVVGEKGELWLARNQDDPTRQIGWIWTRHFAKLST
ncbi:uncharacterized protein N7443_000905 [Penicillium atrosanguineum]|uniref:uncharacterized protein n=1 Tax=Penicillium atrosanguineum TaxID=1132637 RepID=UPI00239B6DF3|nr:uncharacterized protein N7443_000905 [Penicillium atrosanguineum]KAJ5314021.1 hypothetical protein N7443_000905 [Penicillium atrosanguineum]